MLNTFDMLKFDEGLCYKAYKDTVGKTTVGIGFNMDDPNAKGIWLHADIPESFIGVHNDLIPLSTNSVVKLLNTCVDNCRMDLESIFSDFNTYPDNIQLALINLIFNLGKTKFLQFNTFIGFIKSNLYSNAALDLNTTTWTKQVPNRAKRVMALLNNDSSQYL